MKKSNRQLLIVAAMVLACFAAPAQAAASDDFGRIVHHIETQYQVHRQHRWAMGLAGFVVKVSHFSGVKSLKGAIFENQPFINANGDTQFDEVVRRALDSGWQPMVQSWDRHSGERTYIYAQTAGKDMKVLLVTLEPNEAVVFEIKMDPERFSEFARETTGGRKHRHSGSDDSEPPQEQRAEVAAATPQNWNGVCLLAADQGAAGEP
jgi:hypothetical protein